MAKASLDRITRLPRSVVYVGKGYWAQRGFIARAPQPAEADPVVCLRRDWWSEVVRVYAAAERYSVSVRKYLTKVWVAALRGVHENFIVPVPGYFIGYVQRQWPQGVVYLLCIGNGCPPAVEVRHCGVPVAYIEVMRIDGNEEIVGEIHRFFPDHTIVTF